MRGYEDGLCLGLWLGLGLGLLAVVLGLSVASCTNNRHATLDTSPVAR